MALKEAGGGSRVMEMRTELHKSTGREGRASCLATSQGIGEKS